MYGNIVIATNITGNIDSSTDSTDDFLIDEGRYATDKRKNSRWNT